MVADIETQRGPIGPAGFRAESEPFRMGRSLGSRMRGVDRRALGLSFVAAGVLLGVLVWLVDVGRVGGTLRRADLALVGVSAVFAILWLAAWGGTLRTVLATIDTEMSSPTAFFVYSGAVFANNVTPFGQAGGEPVAALLISKVARTRYETGLVGIASVDVLNAIASVAIVFVGVGVYALSFRVGSGLQAAVGSIAGLGVIVFVVFSLVWRYRARIVERTAGPIAGAARRFPSGPFGDWQPNEDDIAARFRHFFGDVEVVAGDQRALARALSFSTAGWLVQGAGLVTAFAALGYQVPFVVAVFVIPLAYVAGMAPLPGGLGSIEAAFVALLVPTTGIEAAVVTAAVLLFRLAMYWLPIVIGGAAATAYGVTVVS